MSIIQSSSYVTVDCCRLPLKICLVSKRKVASSSSLLTLKALRQYGHFGTLVNASPHLYYPLLWAYIFYSNFCSMPCFSTGTISVLIAEDDNVSVILGLDFTSQLVKFL